MNNLACALEELSWIHSLIKCLLSTYCVPAPALRPGKAEITETVCALESSTQSLGTCVVRAGVVGGQGLWRPTGGHTPPRVRPASQSLGVIRW